MHFVPFSFRCKIPKIVVITAYLIRLKSFFRNQRFVSDLPNLPFLDFLWNEDKGSTSYNPIFCSLFPVCRSLWASMSSILVKSADIK